MKHYRGQEVRLLIMKFAGDNNCMIGKNFINQPVFLGNTARPISRQIPFKRLRFAGSVKRVPQYFGNQSIDFTENLFVFLCPLPVINESSFLKTNHDAAARSSAQWIACSSVSKETMFLPCSTFLIAFSKWLRLAGELLRYSVSSCSRTIISMFWSGYMFLRESIKLLPSSCVLSRYVVSIPITITEKAVYFKRREKRS